MDKLRRLKERGSAHEGNPRRGPGPRSPAARQWLLAFATAATGTVAGCLLGGDEPDHGTAVVSSPIGGTAACMSTAATGNNGRAVAGSGGFMSPGGYNPSTCSKAFLIDVNDYKKTNNYGTTVAYAGPVPTNEPDCRRIHVAAYAWRRTGSTTGTFLGSRSVAGRWSFNINNVGRCIVPAIEVDRAIPGYKPDDTTDFRLALSAWVGAGTTPASADVTHPVGFFAKHMDLPTPYGAVASLAEWRVSFPAPPNTILPAIHDLWINRNTPRQQMGCRALQLSRTLATFSGPAYVKAGATQASITATNNGMTALYTNLCTSGGTEANLQTAVRDVVNGVMDIFNSMQNVYNGRLGTAHADVTIAATMDQLSAESLGDLMARCGLNPEAPLKYILDGTLPTGVASDRLLLGTCSNQTPSQASASLQIGALFGSQTLQSARDNYVDCLMEGTEDTCNSPIAEGSAPAQPSSDPPRPCRGNLPDGSCSAAEHTLWLQEFCKGTGPNGTCTTQEAMAFESTVVNRDKVDTTTGQVINQAQPAANPAENAGVGKAFAFGIGIGVTGTLGVVGGTLAVVNPEPLSKVGFGVGAAALWGTAAKLTHEACEDFPSICRTIDGVLQRFGDANGCVDANGNTYCDFDGPNHNRMCGPNFGVSGFGYWYNGASGTQLDRKDRLNHCGCKMLDAAYAQAPGVTRLQSALCPDVFDREKQDCVTNVGGPNDGFNPRCIEHLEPRNQDTDAIKGKLCELLLDCNNGEEPRWRELSKTCTCVAVSPPGSGGGNLPCVITPFATNGLCGGEDPSSCFCTPEITPAPNGGNPLCGFDPTKVPGPKDAWSMSDPGVAYFTTFGGVGITGANAAVEAFAMRGGGISAMASPNLFAHTFAQRGTTVRLKTAIRQAPATGQNILLQLYYTNKAENVIHAFAGQCDMRGFAVNTVTNCDFPLPTVQRPNPITGQQETVAIANLGGRYNFEVLAQTAANYLSRVMVGPLSYTGTVIPTPTGQQVTFCPTPDPLPTGLPRPLAPNINPTFKDFAGIWTFVNAGTGIIPDSVFRVTEVAPIIR